MHLRSEIIATGSFVPENIVANRDLKKFPAALIPLIEQKTGVKTRRFADETQCTSDLAIIAGKRCLEKASIEPLELDGIILTTSSPDRIQPATATRVQHGLGASRAFAFDINSVCSGGIYSLAVADAFLKSRAYKKILVVASEIYSQYLDPADFSTYPYFGDGAGAILLSSQTGNDRGICESILKTDGSKADVIQIPAGGTMLPYHRLTNPKDIFFKMIGREVYNFAVTEGSNIINEIIDRSRINKDDIRFIIPHQANINIIKEISSRTGINLNKFIINLDKYGNTAAASVLITLDELLSSGIIENGDLILLVAFGGGLSWGASLIRY